MVNLLAHENQNYSLCCVDYDSPRVTCESCPLEEVTMPCLKRGTVFSVELEETDLVKQTQPDCGVWQVGSVICFLIWSPELRELSS